MVSQTNEQALENCIEQSLVKGSRYEKGSLASIRRNFDASWKRPNSKNWRS